MIRAEHPGELLIAIRRSVAGGSLDASFRLESLVPPEEEERRDLNGVSDWRPALPQAGRTATVGGISLLAHLAVRGDVEVGGDEWAAGPESPTPIEGIAISADNPYGVTVEAQVLVASRPPRWSPWIRPGEFAGTRGRSLTLAGVRLRLGGADADRMEISADALFLGSAVMSKRGRELEFVSSAGLDPLIGFRLGLRAAEITSVPQTFAGAARDREPRVRVFRAAANT